jgi:hypothetical protein
VAYDLVYENLKAVEVFISQNNKQITRLIEHIKFLKLDRSTITRDLNLIKLKQKHSEKDNTTTMTSICDTTNEDEESSFIVEPNSIRSRAGANFQRTNSSKIEELNKKVSRIELEDERAEDESGVKERDLKKSSERDVLFYSQLHELLRKRKQIPAQSVSLQQLDLFDSKFDHFQNEAQMALPDTSFLKIQSPNVPQNSHAPPFQQQQQQQASQNTQQFIMPQQPPSQLPPPAQQAKIPLGINFQAPSAAAAVSQPNTQTGNESSQSLFNLVQQQPQQKNQQQSQPKPPPAFPIMAGQPSMPLLQQQQQQQTAQMPPSSFNFPPPQTPTAQQQQPKKEQSTPPSSTPFNLSNILTSKTSTPQSASQFSFNIPSSQSQTTISASATNKPAAAPTPSALTMATSTPAAQSAAQKNLFNPPAAPAASVAQKAPQIQQNNEDTQKLKPPQSQSTTTQQTAVQQQQQPPPPLLQQTGVKQEATAQNQSLLPQLPSQGSIFGKMATSSPVFSFSLGTKPQETQQTQQAATPNLTLKSLVGSTTQQPAFSLNLKLGETVAKTAEETSNKPDENKSKPNSESSSANGSVKKEETDAAKPAAENEAAKKTEETTTGTVKPQVNEISSTSAAVAATASAATQGQTVPVAENPADKVTTKPPATPADINQKPQIVVSNSTESVAVAPVQTQQQSVEQTPIKPAAAASAFLNNTPAVQPVVQAQAANQPNSGGNLFGTTSATSLFGGLKPADTAGMTAPTQSAGAFSLAQNAPNVNPFTALANQKQQT